MRLALLLACGTALILAGLLVVQGFAPGDDGADATGVVPASRVRLPAASPAEAPAAALHADDWVATILGRPLFTRDRRPADAPAAVAAASPGGALPRLTGIAISPDQKRAIFAGADGAKPIVVEEGGTIAGFTVETIDAAGVKVQGPNGEQTVSVAFDPTPPTQIEQAQPPTQPMPPPYPQAYPQPPQYPMPYTPPGQAIPGSAFRGQFGVRPGLQQGVPPGQQPMPGQGMPRPNSGANLIVPFDDQDAGHGGARRARTWA